MEPHATSQARVVCVDENPSVRDGLAAMLRGSGKFTVVGTLPRASDLLERGPALNPHLVLLDLDMPGEDSLGVMAAFLEKVPGARVLIFSAHYRPELVRCALDAGAFGYIWKSDGLEELYRCMSAALTGHLAFSESIVDGFRSSGKHEK